MPFTLIAATLLLNIAIAVAEPQPGDVWREYVWNGPFVNADGWQRVTDPAAAASGARNHLPNRVNRIRLEDLDRAIRAEVYIEYWGGHTGTTGKAMRVNGRPWHDLPRLEAIPGDAGLLPNSAAECYQHYSYATVPLPLAELHEGENTFEFDAGPQVCNNFGWGQWGIYGVTFRVYYDPSAKPHPTGRILTPDPGHVFSDSLLLEAAASSPLGDILAVDFIGLYEDYDFEGNGLWRQWHYFYRYGQIKRHIATVEEAPFRAEWDTRWVPDQPQPIAFVARIRDTAGMMALSEPVTDIRMERSTRSVRMYKPYKVATNWVSRVGRYRTADVFVPEDLTLAVAARMALTTWSGGHADSVGINRRRVVRRAGPAHDYGYITPEIPLDLLRRGTNTFFTASNTSEHGIEVMWPGIVLFVEYGTPTAPPAPAAADLSLFADSLHPGWTTSVPPDGSIESTGALRIGISSSFRDFFELRGEPIPLAGFRAIRFDLHPGDLRIADYQSLDLVIWDEETPLMIRGKGQRGLDFERGEWQTVEIPFHEMYLRYPYLDSIGLRGRLTGDLLIDDVRLVTDAGTAVTGETSRTPAAFTLEPAYPNPFNAGVMLPFHLPREGRVELAVFDLTGQRVATVTDALFPAGHHAVQWFGRNDSGLPAASGVYLVQLRFGSDVSSSKALLLR